MRLHLLTDFQRVNMDSIKMIDNLTDNIIDMYIPMMDLADMSYNFHYAKGKTLAVECEEIISKLLNLITIFMNKTTCMRNKNVLKHYYNKYYNLKFANGNIESFTPLDIKLQEKFVATDMEIFIMKICSSYKALHHFISVVDHLNTFISRKIFLESLKKMVLCVISMIFNMKLDYLMKDVLSDLEGMQAKICF